MSDITLLNKWMLALAIAADYRIPASAARVALSLINHCNRKTGECWPSYATLAKEGGMTRECAIKSVKVLQNYGWVETERRTEAGKRVSATNRFRLPFDRVRGSEQNSPPPSEQNDPTVVNKIHYGSEQNTLGGSEQNSPEPFYLEPGYLTREREPGRERAKRAPLPLDWQPSTADFNFALKEGLTEAEINRQAELFQNYYRANGTLRADWSAVWRTWVMRIPSFNKAAAACPSSPTSSVGSQSAVAGIGDFWKKAGQA